ncbi:hypothetical protein QBC46DRAFT_458876 [Diplogelasinospora grovesii]|uniref:Zn(2)-C6 fungal-type domain-containing protein n=1 Tax=Diplogelasinospora grovesii TaxID=303347 RepID=A0AAN6NA73_9PEZI|nr:hypothetical protein QBC46DRAFT_458876 [Diplogelasinospora grovesii]
MADRTAEKSPVTENKDRNPLARPRITNACEACRAAKVKCQASNQLGICRRCLDSKRECIFKTGPRTRRPRQSRLNNDTAPRPPPPAGPSKTFTIDIPMPYEDDVADSLEALRLSHEGFIDGLVPWSGDDDDDEMDGQDGYDYEFAADEQDWLGSVAGSSTSHASSLPVGASALSTPPGSVVNNPSGSNKSRMMPTAPSKMRSVASLGLQPQFNLDSATALLTTFRDTMIAHFPCVVIPEEATVSSLAKDRPFVLLAVLAAASGSRTLQGHSLYNEEFRKILGLKFVAGGERSMELLQGLVVYVAWYPFHLRPKNKQAFQYIRMAVDMVNDLELDQDPGTDELDGTSGPERLDEIRTYLSTYYLVSNFATTWNRTPPLLYGEYTGRCCDFIESRSPMKQDRILAWQVRLQRLVEETNDLRKNQRGHSQSEYQIGLMLKGMETQLAEWEGRMLPDVAAAPSLRIAVNFTRIFLSGAPLLKLPSVKLPNIDSSSTFRADPHRLASVIPALHATYDHFLTLPAAEINAFSGVDWGSFILAVILGFRMSFPLAVCPEWDDKEARRQIRFGEYLDRLCRMGKDRDEDGEEIRARLTPAASSQKSMDVLNASKIVLGVVRKKFQRRLAKLEPPPPPPPPAARAGMPHPGHGIIGNTAGTVGDSALQLDAGFGGCPMMDGSLEPYYAYWDETFSDPSSLNPRHHHHHHHAHSGLATLPPDMGQGMTATSYQDLWAAMTMGWAHTDDINFDGI